jgi:hypothetical protein
MPAQKPEVTLARFMETVRERLHPDRTGFMVAAAVTGIVLAWGVFVVGLSVQEVLFRALVTFVVTWLAVFLLVVVVYWIADRELAPAPQPADDETSESTESTEPQEPGTSGPTGPQPDEAGE